MSIPQGLEEEIERLNGSKVFSDKEFFAAYYKIRALTAQTSLTEIEGELLNLLRVKNLSIVNGFLAVLYLGINDLANAQKFALEAKKCFPDSKLWPEVLKGSIWEDFKQGGDEN